MFFARSHVDLHNIRTSVERVGNLSDNVIRFGPVKIGLEGVLEFVPFLGEFYSIGAGLLLLTQGFRVRLPAATLMSVGGLIGLRTLIGTSNFLGPFGLIGELAAAAFRAHKRSADLIVKAMDETLYVEGGRNDPANAEIVARIRNGAEPRRVIFLG